MRTGAHGRTADPAGRYVPGTGQPVRKLPPRFANRQSTMNNAAPSRGYQASHTSDRSPSQSTAGLIIIIIIIIIIIKMYLIQ